MWPQTHFATSLSFRFLDYKIEIMTAPTTKLCFEDNWENTLILALST